MTAALSKNLEALAKHQGQLASVLANMEETEPLATQKARSGDLIPLLPHAGGKMALHSLFDPEREALRLKNVVCEQTESDEPFFLYFEGLGAGFQVRAFLEDNRLSEAVVVETDLALFKALLSAVDLSLVLSHPAIQLFVDPSPEQLSDYLKAAYLPAAMGSFLSVPLRPRVQAHSEYFDTLRAAVRSALDEISVDLSVQAHFGRLWTRNIAVNLPELSRTMETLPAPDEVIVAAAGPSLERNRTQLEALRKGRYLIATDTALPTLQLWGRPPDAVLTIDSQSISYRHYLRGLPQEALLFAELAAPPPIFRLSSRVVPLAGHHPLSILAAKRLGPFPVVDTSGGNVGHAAVSLALELGASMVYLFGADFSYPKGKSYARGTHLYDYFGSYENRLRPLESGMSGLLLRNTPLRRRGAHGSFVYSTENLDAYRQRFQDAFAPYHRRISIVAGDGIPIVFPDTPAAIPSSSSSPLARPTNSDIAQFITEYLSALRNLPPIVPPRFASSDPSAFTHWEIFATIYPLMARLQKEKKKPLRLASIYTDAIEMALRFFERAQNRQGTFG